MSPFPRSLTNLLPSSNRSPQPSPTTNTNTKYGDPFLDTPPPHKSPKLLATPSSATLSRFSLPSASNSSASSTTLSSNDSNHSATLFWHPPTATPSSRSPTWSAARRQLRGKKQVILLVLVGIVFGLWVAASGFRGGDGVVHVTVSREEDQGARNPYQILRTEKMKEKEGQADPLAWLDRNSGDKWAEKVGGGGLLGGLGSMFEGMGGVSLGNGKPKAALISLVRNSELEGIVQSMTQLEWRWNRKYNYPWVFFNDEEFSEEFKAATSNLTSAPCYYEVVPEAHWSLPDWIDEGRFMNSLEYLGAIGVGKGWMISYRHMCRWNSGFFYKHPRLLEFDWYWRVEPDVHFFCDIDYDIFRFMRDNNLKYGFNMNILDDARSFPSLWSRTRAFINTHPELIHPDADLDWLLDNHNSGDYNNCQFFSNFEVGSLNFFRGEANEKYFEWLDRGGGFYYERFGDAPIHTLSVAMFVPKREIWFFRDVGYQHDINRHCPPHSSHRCNCEPTPLDENFYKLVPLESPQKKPDDTCIRLFLGGHYLQKKEGWNAEAERAYGGDGFGGYVDLTGEGEL